MVIRRSSPINVVVFGILLSQVTANTVKRASIAHQGTRWMRTAGALPEEGDVRLSGGEKTDTNWYGRVEIYHAGEWGTVCKTEADDLDIMIICGGLGYREGYDTGIVTPGSGRIWMDRLNCFYPAESLAECEHSGWAVNDCSHDQDLGVYCVDPVFIPPDPNNPRDDDVRLVGGEKTEDSWTGRVEIYHAGQWGTVCNMGVGYADQWTICRGLGYSEVSWDNHATPGSGPIWMSNLNCGFEATKLAECEHDGWGVTQCDHRQDLAVHCHDYEYLKRKK